MKGRIWKDLTLADITLIVLLLLATVLSGIYFTRKPHDRSVYIYKNGIKYGEYPLQKDAIIRVDEHNTVEIRSGKVGMRFADCPDKRCVKQGYGNMLPIICLPNKLVVEVKASEDEKKFLLQ
ncbi:MAG TPA: NusG domain II-containing protein [Candidatus Cloacimonadota bacterium]|nr:NusG domain II-containing protein [Candidatus Cloacimonadota bacterium]